MFWIELDPSNWEKYVAPSTIYLGPRATVYFQTADVRIDPETGEWEITGVREQKGTWPILPSMYPSWIGKGIFNFISDKTVGKFLKWLDIEENPLRLEYHIGKEDTKVKEKLPNANDIKKGNVLGTRKKSMPGLGKYPNSKSLDNLYLHDC